MSEKLCLQWNNFNENIVEAFGSLRQDNDFTDVTLACEDGDQIEVHKVILASSSPFFQNLLKRNKHPHPLIYMRGMKSEDMSAIMDFLYCGEAKIFQENLDTFLTVAEVLKLKGLTKEVESEDGLRNENGQRKPVVKRESSNQSLFHPKTALTKQRDSVNQKRSLLDGNIPPFLENTVAIPDQIFLGGLDEQIDSMVATTDKIDPIRKNLKLVSCTACGKEGSRIDVKRHIEAKHIDGVSHNCEVCGKTAR